MEKNALLPVDRFLHTLKVVEREGAHLAYSWQRLFAEPVSGQWVKRLEQHPELAERLEAFVSRLGPAVGTPLPALHLAPHCISIL
jgi:hypothetical protein